MARGRRPAPLPRSESRRKHFLHLQAHKEALRIVATAAASSLLPHILLRRARSTPWSKSARCPASVRYEYERADTAAMQKLLAPLPFPSRCMMAWMKAKGLASPPYSLAALSPSRSANSAAQLTSGGVARGTLMGLGHDLVELCVSQGYRRHRSRLQQRQNRRGASRACGSSWQGVCARHAIS